MAAQPVVSLPPSPLSEPSPVPPLETGDRLTREEFERRYRAMPHVKKAELIEGVVYMPSPVSLQRHGLPHLDAMGWLGVYRAFTQGVLAGDNSTIRLDLDNEPQPDGILFIDPKLGGQAQMDADGYVAGAPEMAVEIASTSASIDLGIKLHVYRRNQVREYVVWRVLDRAIDWFVLRHSQFERLAMTAEGIFRSETFPGLWLDAAALVSGDLPRVHQVLQQGLASAEHAAFMDRLKTKVP